MTTPTPIFKPHNSNIEARDNLETLAAEAWQRGDAALAGTLAQAGGLYAIASAVITACESIDAMAEALTEMSPLRNPPA
jgi:hypothetical protein